MQFLVTRTNVFNVKVLKLNAWEFYKTCIIKTCITTTFWDEKLCGKSLNNPLLVLPQDVTRDRDCHVSLKLPHSFVL